MKLLKLNQQGLAHYILPALVVLVIGAVGATVLMRSHAATMPYLGFDNLSSVSNNDGVSVFTSIDSLPGVGTQNVADIIPGKQLIFNNFPGKTLLSSVCYQVRVYNSPKAAVQVTTANVTFAGAGSTKTVSLPADDKYREVCVNSGKGAQVNYNIWNRSSSAYILVYQAIRYY